MSEPSLSNLQPDLSLCEQEPIHIPGFIEPNGALVVLDERNLRIVQASSNSRTFLGIEAQDLPGRQVSELVDNRTAGILQRLSNQDLGSSRRYVKDVHLQQVGHSFDLSVHRSQGLLILEFEPAAVSYEENEADFITLISESLAQIQERLSLDELCRSVARSVQQLTGFDRVMVYRFLEDGTGSVIAEDRREDLISYFGLRYPASDIPSQARRLYLLNRIRVKSDVSAPRVPVVPVLNPLTSAPLDMSLCILRAMSPVHVEYLQNMGVLASMSVSIVRDGALWGLIACHHMQPKIVPHRIRLSCEVLAGVFSCHIPAAEDRDNAERSRKAQQYISEARERLHSNAQVATALLAESSELADLMDAVGVAIFIDQKLSLAGSTPTAETLAPLLQWLESHQTEHLFYTDKLSEVFPSAELQEIAGLLSARVADQGRDFILWFRPPALKTVEWAGNPEKPVEQTETGKRISPRLSFERWKQTVGDRSEEWKTYERDFALSLRQVVAEALLTEKNQEVSRLNSELVRSNIELDAFAYAASHDLQEPLRTIRAYTQLLLKRTSTTLGDDDRNLLKTIEAGSGRMTTLLAALLEFAQVGGAAARGQRSVNLEDTLSIVLINLKEAIRLAEATITHDPLPLVRADPEQMTQVLQNLVSNGLKYRRADVPANLHISALQQGSEVLVGVRDNGSGFDPKHAETVFGAFKRLHGREIPGTGIGLALCKRIIEAHGGRIWAESSGEGQGATFWFTLPAA